MKDLGKTKFCLGLQIEHLQMTSSTPVYFCTESIREIQYGQNVPT
jgi:hypothetical protein